MRLTNYYFLLLACTCCIQEGKCQDVCLEKKQHKIKQKGEMYYNKDRLNIQSDKQKENNYEGVYKEKLRKYSEDRNKHDLHKNLQKTHESAGSVKFQSPHETKNDTSKTCVKSKYQLNCKRKLSANSNDEQQGKKKGGKSLYIKRENNPFKDIEDKNTNEKQGNTPRRGKKDGKIPREKFDSGSSGSSSEEDFS